MRLKSNYSPLVIFYVHILHFDVVTAVLLLTSTIITCAIRIVCTIEKSNLNSKYYNKSIERILIEKINYLGIFLQITRQRCLLLMANNKSITLNFSLPYCAKYVFPECNAITIE